MTRIPYTKTIKTFDEQIGILKSRGLQFNDEMRAKQLLQNISYYRMSGYWYPLLADKQNHIFKSEAIFAIIIAVCGTRFWEFVLLFQEGRQIPLFQFPTLPTIRFTMYCA